MDSQFERFETAFNRMTLFFAALVAISIGLIAFLIPLNLVMIRLQLGGIWWLFEGIEYALFAGVFLGAPWVLQQNAHVKVDVLVSALPKAAAARLERILNIIAIVLCLFLCFYGVRATIAEYIDGTMPDKDLRIANWIVLSIYAFSFLMLAVEFALRLRRSKDTLMARESAVAESGF